ncbi:hypothetical protein [Caballeronia arvi]|uniref:hypothetical protein n=1 Tax=Caballeronia arvi TaxID=1777135 RepID=UPI000A7D5684|nr:hypothetical protein [Caballeronia arvi]
MFALQVMHRQAFVQARLVRSAPSFFAFPITLAVRRKNKKNENELPCAPHIGLYTEDFSNSDA